MSALAVPELDDVDLFAARLHELEKWLAEADDQRAVSDVLDQARLVRELVRLRDLAASVAKSALRIEILALRRLGQLGHKFRKNTDYLAACFFKKVSVEDIDHVLAEDDCPRTALTIHQHLKRRNNVAAAKQEIEDGDGIACSPENGPPPYSLAEAAAIVLQGCTDEGTEFTVTAAANELLDAIGREHSDLHVAAARQLIHGAMTLDVGDSQGFPQVVTFQKFGAYGEPIWIRIPWRNATIEQLRWMAEYRWTQARRLMKAAENLSELVDRAEAEAGRCSRDLEATCLGDLYGYVKDKAAA